MKLKTNDLAERLGIHRRTLIDWRNKGHLKRAPRLPANAAEPLLWDEEAIAEATELARKRSRPRPERKAGVRPGRPAPPIRTASPTLRRLFEIADEAGVTTAELHRRTGRATNVIHGWRAGKSEPGIMGVEEIAAALGAKLEAIDLAPSVDL